MIVNCSSLIFAIQANQLFKFSNSVFRMLAFLFIVSAKIFFEYS